MSQLITTPEVRHYKSLKLNRELKNENKYIFLRSLLKRISHYPRESKKIQSVKERDITM